jgi:translation initiation factor IF-1
MSTKSGYTEYEGEVTEALPNTLFRVSIKEGQIFLCHLSGRLRMNYIKIIPGDHVKFEVSDYDKTKGRITYRLK